MKNIKRFLSVCLSLIMLLSSSFVVLADSNETNEAKEANESFVSLDEIAKYEDKMYADSAPNEIVITDPVAIQKLATEQGFPDVEDIKKLTYTIGKVGQSALDDEIPQKEVPEMDAVEEIISKISEDSPYKRRPTQKRTWMTVPEMGKLLGLKKTDSILKNDPDIEFDELRFAVDDDGTNILVIINKGEITGAVDIDNMYEFASSHCNDFKDLRDDDEIVINREWILNKLAEAENE
jgi:hypothetical protein